MSDSFVVCAVCGHQFPVAFVRQRGKFTCGCGMRIDSDALRSKPGAPHSALALVMMAFVIGLLVAAYVMARRLVG